MKTFHHFGLTVRSIDASFAFYTDVMDMTVWDQERELNVEPAKERRAVVEPGQHDFMAIKSETFATLTNNPEAAFKYVMLGSSDGALVLQLTEYVAGGMDGPRGGHSRIGGVHFSFFVDDVDATWKEIDARGDIPIVSAVIQITPSMRSFYIEDPDGNPVELLQIVR